MRILLTEEQLRQGVGRLAGEIRDHYAGRPLTIVGVLIPQIDELGPASVRSAVLLRKRGRREVPVEPDFVGFDVPDEFVVGYGLDHRDLYRNLPYVAALDWEELSGESSG